MTDAMMFYQDLPSVDNLAEVTNQSIYVNMPTDWLIALTDVRGSTKAIEEGRYKDVNAVAAASITALLNSMPGAIEIPFVFGGDGATVVFPVSLRSVAADALIACQRLARDQFQLDLRVGIVPITDVIAHGYQVRIAKLRYSENFQQAIFTGGGLAHADHLIKDEATARLYLLEDDGLDHVADFSGYECRWSEFPSAAGENISLLVMASSRDDRQSSQVYRDTIRQIETIYGSSSERNPIRFQRMLPTMNLAKFGVETRIRHQTSQWLARLKLMLWTWGGYLLWKYRVKIWDRYKQTVLASTDREKFDDILRMLISGTPQQRAQLEAFLEDKRGQGLLVYGIHVSRAALMTCLVFDRFGRQVHFVDGSDGGYALAARQMKAQIASRNADQGSATPL